ncbi:hypothetical protein SEUCBS139899_002503 [Sporothrix eucalyptigena]
MAFPSSSIPPVASPASFASALAQLTPPDHPVESVERQRERCTSTIAVNGDVGAITPRDSITSQQRQQATPQQVSSGIPLQVAQMHIAMHENFHKQKGQRRKHPNTNNTNVPWPKRWLGSQQWRQQQQQGRDIGLWENSFDGTSATAGTSLTGKYHSKVTHKLSDRVTCEHAFTVTGVSSGTATAGDTSSAATTQAAAATADQNKAVGSWASKPNGTRAKIAGNMANAPMKLMWLLNPRETLFQWAQARSDDTERAKRKALKEQRRQRKKAAAKRKAEGLPPLTEEDEELSQRLQEALVGSATVPSSTIAAPLVNGEIGGEGLSGSGDISAVAQLPSGESSVSDAATASTSAMPLETVHKGSVTALSVVGHRLVTQYGRIWMPQQTPHGEEEASIDAGDGAVSDLGDIGSVLSNCGGLVAPPNSVADSVYGHPAGVGQESEYGQFQSNFRGSFAGAAGPSISRYAKLLTHEASEDDRHSFVTCMSQQ